MLVRQTQGMPNLVQSRRVTPFGGEVPAKVHGSPEVLILQAVRADKGPGAVGLESANADLGFGHVVRFLEYEANLDNLPRVEGPAHNILLGLRPAPLVGLEEMILKHRPIHPFPLDGAYGTGAIWREAFRQYDRHRQRLHAELDRPRGRRRSRFGHLRRWPATALHGRGARQQSALSRDLWRGC